MTNTCTYSVRINAGPVQELMCRAPTYCHAAVAALSFLEYDNEETSNAVVEIWVEKFLNEPYCPPLFYEISRDRYGNLVTQHLMSGCTRRDGGSLIWNAYQGAGVFKWHEWKDGGWHPLPDEPQRAILVADAAGYSGMRLGTA